MKKKILLEIDFDLERIIAMEAVKKNVSKKKLMERLIEEYAKGLQL